MARAETLEARPRDPAPAAVPALAVPALAAAALAAAALAVRLKAAGQQLPAKLLLKREPVALLVRAKSVVKCGTDLQPVCL
jgi:hypothetical protein